MDRLLSLGIVLSAGWPVWSKRQESSCRRRKSLLRRTRRLFPGIRMQSRSPESDDRLFEQADGGNFPCQLAARSGSCFHPVPNNPKRWGTGRSPHPAGVAGRQCCSADPGSSRIHRRLGWGCRPALSPGLRSGTYSIQGYIDLHGMSRVEAREAVEDFIVRMSRARSCCVKIVHGRGIQFTDRQSRSQGEPAAAPLVACFHTPRRRGPQPPGGPSRYAIPQRASEPTAAVG